MRSQTLPEHSVHTGPQVDWTEFEELVRTSGSDRPARWPETDQPTRTPVRRRPGRSRRAPRGRDERFRGPRLRPAISPGFRTGETSAAGPVAATSAGCRTTSAPRWRITDRGIAVVLMITAMVAVAALTVVGATAWRVTGEHYQAAVQLR